MPRSFRGSFATAYALDPSTGERRIDPISLSSYPLKYAIRTSSGSHHDARELAKYVISGGWRHPLTRREFTEGELQHIAAVLTHHHPLFRKFVTTKNVLVRRLLNRRIVYAAGARRAAGFLQFARSVLHLLPSQLSMTLEAVIDACTGGIHSIPQLLQTPSLTILDVVYASLKHTELPSQDAICITETLHTDDLAKKRRFMKTLADRDGLAYPGEVSKESFEKLAQRLAQYNVKMNFLL